MRITRIRLTDFKRHAELEMEPAPGLTIVRGPNESGKSSIQEALELGLFRKADSRAGDILAAHRWGSRESPTVELDFEVDGEAASLAKRFAGPRAEGVLSLAGQAIKDPDLIRERLATMTGIPNESFFRSTASVAHSELDGVAGDDRIIQDRLQRAISGADRGTAAAKRKLESAIHRYRTEGQKNPGLLKVARQEMAMLETELARGETALRSLEEDRARWAEAHERRVGLEAQLAIQQAALAEARRAASLAEARDAAQDRYDRLKRGTELVIHAGQLERQLPADVPLAGLRSAVARANNLSLELAELEAETNLEAVVGTTQEPVSLPSRPLPWLVVAAALVVLAAAAWFVVGGLLGAAALILFAVGTIAALVQSVRLALRRRQEALAQELAQRSAEQLRAAGQDRQEAFRRTRHELESQLAALRVSELAEAEAMLATAEAQTQQLAQIEGELRGLGVEERSVRRLETARDQAANECEQARHALAGMGELAEDPAAALLAAQRVVEQTLPARDLARSEEDQAQGRVGANEVDAEVVAGVAERLAATRERAAEMERRVAVYESTLRAIEAAEQATLKTAARYLEEHMGPAIARVTGGRYAEVVVDEKDLAFRVRVPETGELVDVGVLSQGTSDQLFLAARLGLVRLVTMDRRPPLILDDPFVTFDIVRAERALRLVKDAAAAQGFQVLLLTTSDRFDSLADKIIMLEGPRAEPRVAKAASAPAAPPPFAPETTRPVPASAAPAAPAAASKPAFASARAAAPAPATSDPQPTLRFEPDPRPNPDPGLGSDVRAGFAGLATEGRQGLRARLGGRSPGDAVGEEPFSIGGLRDDEGTAVAGVGASQAASREAADRESADRESAGRGDADREDAGPEDRPADEVPG